MKWISLKEQIPPKGEIVLGKLQKNSLPVCIKHDSEEIPRIWENVFSSPKELYVSELITHWQPLLQSPLYLDDEE